MILDAKEPVHIEAISSEEELNKLIKLLESTYKFTYFKVIPLRDKA
jgi:hypothetical protein